MCAPGALGHTEPVTFPVPHNSRVVAGDTRVVTGLTNSGFVDGAVVDTCDDEAPFAGVAITDVLVTHGHADHFAVASAVREAGARSWAARDDASLVENPDINIRGMFSWAKPGDMFVTKLFRGTAVQGRLARSRSGTTPG